VAVTGRKPLSQSVLKTVVIGVSLLGMCIILVIFLGALLQRISFPILCFLLFYSHRHVQVLILLVAPRVFHMYRFTPCKNKYVINVGYLQAVC